MAVEPDMENGPPVRRILVADSHGSRGSRLSEACERLGWKSALASHGSAALEFALASPPDLVVCEVGLPLVDGYKLAEILRANPRTRSACFVFLGSFEDRPHALEPSDRSLPVNAPREEVLRTVQEMMDKRDRIDAFERATLDGDRVDGDLAQLPLAELLQLIALGRKSGRVDLQRECDQIVLEGETGAQSFERGIVLVRDGDILQAEAGDVEGEKALFRLLAWRQGHFSFDPGRRPTEPPKILAPVRALLNEGLRQLAEWDRLSLRLPALDARIRLVIQSSELPNIVHPLTQEVLLLLEHYSVVREIVDRSSFPDYQVLRTLYTLVERGMVEVGQLKVTGLARDTARESLFDEPQLRRLRETLQTLAPRGSRPVAGKILVVASEPETLPDFMNLLRGVPGVELGPQPPPGREPALELAPLGRMWLNDDLWIDLIQVPSSEEYRPLWPIAGHGALATLLLLSGPVGESADRVNGIAEALRSGARARVLNVVLLGRKERISPDELRENLALFDESSLFLLPLESDKEPTALLRSLFSRVVP